MRNLLGGKGANLAEMTNLGLPVPQGFTITTEACTQYYEDGRSINDEIMAQIMEAITKMEGVNNDSETMYFTIGGHPAFRVPVREGESQSDYRLAFEGLDTLTYLLIDTSVGTVLADEPHTLSLENGTCSIAPHMFDKDALVFDNGQIQKAGILFPDGTPYLTLTSEGFPNFGIWSVPGAPFVCLEPWMGRCDDCGFEKPLSEKANINVLKPDEEFIKSYQITVH